MEENPLLGAWRLVRLENLTGDGAAVPASPARTGYLLYTADGYMSALINFIDRPVPASAEWRAATAEEKIAAAEGCTAYAGTYTFHGDHVVHHVLAALNPAFIGTEQVREVTFEDGRLVLGVPPRLLNGVPTRARVVWERVDRSA